MPPHDLPNAWNILGAVLSGVAAVFGAWAIWLATMFRDDIREIRNQVNGIYSVLASTVQRQDSSPATPPSTRDDDRAKARR